MAAPEGNQFWMMRASSGPRLRYETPADLWADCCEYFETRNSVVVNGNPAPYTLKSLCIFLDISSETWCTWRKDRNDLSEVITRVDDIIQDQKFTGAACGLYNHNIIARDLGLADKKEHTGANGKDLMSGKAKLRAFLGMGGDE